MLDPPYDVMGDATVGPPYDEDATVGPPYDGGCYCRSSI